MQSAHSVVCYFGLTVWMLRAVLTACCPFSAWSLLLNLFLLAISLHSNSWCFTSCVSSGEPTVPATPWYVWPPERSPEPELTSEFKPGELASPAEGLVQLEHGHVIKGDQGSLPPRARRVHDGPRAATVGLGEPRICHSCFTWHRAELRPCLSLAL